MTEAIVKAYGRLDITVDPRLELLAVLQYFSQSKMVCRAAGL
ncbi:MAG TPA: hypothetical protein PL124_07445 [Candidatus Cloacimonadota bacterium]|nr:hypothetical protein [Candidatus Cloacimonadota bacterium]